MREILFRGKRLDNGEWVEGGIYLECEKCFIIRSVRYIPDTRDWDTAEYYENNPTFTMEKIAVDPETVGQFTGVKDKNGKKIFDGDVIRERVGDHDAGSLYTVHWVERDGFLFVDNHYKFEWKHDVYFTKDIEVVGNVFDNPELVGK